MFIAAPPVSHLPPPSTAAQPPAAAVSSSDIMGQSDKYDALRLDITSSVASNANAKLDAARVDISSELSTAKSEAEVEEEFADFASFSAEPVASGTTITQSSAAREGLKVDSTQEGDDFLFGSVTAPPKQMTSHSQSSDKYSALKELISNKTLFSAAPVVPPEDAKESRDSDANVLPLDVGEDDFANFASFDNNRSHTTTFHADKPTDLVEQSADDGWADFAAATPATSSEVMPVVISSSAFKSTERKVEKSGKFFSCLIYPVNKINHIHVCFHGPTFLLVAASTRDFFGYASRNSRAAPVTIGISVKH